MRIMKALIIEDDKRLSDNICKSLKNKMEMTQAFDGEQGLLRMDKEKFDIVILDVMMPKIDGFEVLRNMRANGIDTPVIMLTALNQIRDQVQGLNAGADDYLAKPFDLSVLQARIEAILRRSHVNELPDANIKTFLELVMDSNTRTAKIEGKKLELRGKQFDLLLMLVSQKNIIVSRELLFQKVWGFYATTEMSVVDVYVSQIRKELRKYDYEKYFRTIKGIGFLLTDDEEIYG